MARRRHTARIAVAALVVAVGFVAATAAFGFTRTGAWFEDTPSLSVEPNGEQSELYVTLSFGASGPPARVTLSAPAKFDLWPVRPPGTFIGEVAVLAASGDYGSSARSLLRGEIAAARLDDASETAAQACSPGTHVAVWMAELSLLGQPLDLPIYLSNAAPPRSGLELDICAPALATPAGGPPPLLPIESLTFELMQLDPPEEHGSYLWQAMITPFGPDLHSPLPAKTYEIRALVPLPQKLTLNATYRRTTETATFTGRLTANGVPRAAAKIYIDVLQRTVTSKGIRYNDSTVGPAKTNAAGVYVLHTRLRHTAGIQAVVRSTTSRCDDRSMAPGGCRSTTTSSSRSATVTLVVPR